jgi:hypothetical protein
MKYLVTIDSNGIGGSAPNDGFVDPLSVEGYRQLQTYTGAVDATVLAGDSFYVRNIIVTSSGTTISSLVSDINAKTKYHFVVASASTNKLVLRMLPDYTRFIPSITEITPGVLARYGFNAPVISATSAFPTLLQSLTKERGNIRWDLVLQSLQLTSNVEYQVTTLTSANSTTPPTVVAFTIETSDTYYNYDMTGNVVYGKIAIQYAVAKALMFATQKIRKVIEPITISTSPATFYHDDAVQEIIVGAVTSTEQDALDAVTVTVL